PVRALVCFFTSFPIPGITNSPAFFASRYAIELSDSTNATAVFLLVPVASANSVASCVFDLFFAFAISSIVLFLYLISVSFHRILKWGAERRLCCCLLGCPDPPQKDPPAPAAPMSSQQNRGISATRR